MRETKIRVQEAVVTAKGIICQRVLRILDNLMIAELFAIIGLAELMVNVYELYILCNSFFPKWYAIVMHFLYCPKPVTLSVWVHLQDFCKKNKLRRMTTYFSYPRIFLDDMFITVNDYQLYCLIQIIVSSSNDKLYCNGLSVYCLETGMLSV